MAIPQGQPPGAETPWGLQGTCTRVRPAPHLLGSGPHTSEGGLHSERGDWVLNPPGMVGGAEEGGEREWEAPSCRLGPSPCLGGGPAHTHPQAGILGWRSQSAQLRALG